MTVRDEARQRAADELSKPIYLDAGPGLLERATRWLMARITDVLEAAEGAGVGGWFGVLALLVLLVILLVLVRRRTGRVARGGGREATLFLGRAHTADEHRRAADAHAAAGVWEQAVRERLRAVVRALEERGLLDPRPGRTALEAATEAGAVLPGCATSLRAGAELFDAVCNGARPAGPVEHASLLALDRQVAAARPAPLTSPGVPDGVMADAPAGVGAGVVVPRR